MKTNQIPINLEQIYQRLNIPPETLANFCQKNQIRELSLFGSVLREDFNENSDIDLLVVFDSDVTNPMSLMDLVKIQYELEDLIQRKIDLIEKRSVIDSHNWIRRQNILNTAQTIYEARSFLFT
ncbi:nucleotidyltransferase family protein [Gloeothece citriformis]|nr:nucleotidyltransferase domain-containing protein [Gloeothece citriformis]